MHIARREQLRETPAEKLRQMEAVREPCSRRGRLVEPRRTRSPAAVSCVETVEPEIRISDLPSHLLNHVLLVAPESGDVLRDVAVFAQVHPSWRTLAAESAAYAPALYGDARKKVLRSIRAAVRRSHADGKLRLAHQQLGAEGAGALAAALATAPLPIPVLLVEIQLSNCALTPHAAAALGAAMRRGRVCESLRLLKLDDNAELGDDGLEALAKAPLPPSLEELFFVNTGCGDRGMAVVSAALPATLTKLICGMNKRIGREGWAALSAALPRLPHLRKLWVSHCDGTAGVNGVASLGSALPRASSLEEFWAKGCAIGDDGASLLAKGIEGCGKLKVLDMLDNQLSDETKQDLKENAEACGIGRVLTHDAILASPIPSRR